MKRLYEVNDGSFEIDDRETERVKNLRYWDFDGPKI